MDEYTNNGFKECVTCECQRCESRFEEDLFDMNYGLCKECYYENKAEEIDYYHYQDTLKEEDEEVLDQFFLNDFEIIEKEADSRQESDDGDPKLQRKEAERIIKCHINYNFRPQNVEKFFEVIHDEEQLEEDVLEFAENWSIEGDRKKELRKCKTDTLYKQKLMRYAWSDYLLNKLIEECYFDISYF
jgi:hypothetical protein